MQIGLWFKKMVNLLFRSYMSPVEQTCIHPALLLCHYWLTGTVEIFISMVETSHANISLLTLELTTLA